MPTFLNIWYDLTLNLNRKAFMFVITGGGSGLGRALTLALVKRNKKVLIVGRREERLQKTAALSPLIDYLSADVSTELGLNQIVCALKNQNNLEGLINNAGTLDPIIPITQIEASQWHQTMKTNLDAALFLPQKLQTQLSNGRVLNVSSGVAHFAVPNWASYCVSKAALSMLTLCWQEESNDIAFASVMPGIVDTEMQELARENDQMDEAKRLFFQNLKTTGKLLACDTVAEFLVWLLLETTAEQFSAQEWDVYDTSHHSFWLKAPHSVPPLG